MQQVLDKILDFSSSELNIAIISDDYNRTIIEILAKVRSIVKDLRDKQYIRLEVILNEHTLLFKFNNEYSEIKRVYVSVWTVNEKLYSFKFNGKRPTVGVVAVPKHFSVESVYEGVKGLEYCLHPNNREIIYV